MVLWYVLILVMYIEALEVHLYKKVGGVLSRVILHHKPIVVWMVAMQLQPQLVDDLGHVRVL